MANLTREEQQRVKAKRQNDRPSYYSADLEDDVEISQEFETFLILQGSSRNRDTVEWLTKTSDLAQNRNGRDGIIQEAIDFDRKDNEALESEIEDELSAFEKFREEFQSGRFSSTVETGILLSDLQKPAAEVFFEQARAKHLSNMHRFAEGRLRNQGITGGQARQIQSWITPLLTY